MREPHLRSGIRAAEPARASASPAGRTAGRIVERGGRDDRAGCEGRGWRVTSRIGAPSRCGAAGVWGAGAWAAGGGAGVCGGGGVEAEPGCVSAGAGLLRRRGLRRGLRRARRRSEGAPRASGGALSRSSGTRTACGSTRAGPRSMLSAGAGWGAAGCRAGCATGEAGRGSCAGGLAACAGAAGRRGGVSSSRAVGRRGGAVRLASGTTANRSRGAGRVRMARRGPQLLDLEDAPVARAHHDAHQRAGAVDRLDHVEAAGEFRTAHAPEAEVRRRMSTTSEGGRGGGGGGA